MGIVVANIGIIKYRERMMVVDIAGGRWMVVVMMVLVE